MAVYAAAGDLTIVALNAADHRLRDLVQRTGDLTIATDLGPTLDPRVDGSARRRESW